MTMRSIIRLLLVVLVAAAWAGCEPGPPPEPAAPEPQPESEARPERAPDFTLPTLDGGTFTLSDHAGEVVVLNFWATWCLPCLAEMPTLEALQHELGDQGVQIVGISQDTGGVDEIRPYAAELGVTYPLLVDPGFNVSTRYGGISLLPTTIIVDRAGTIAHSEFGALSRTQLLALLDGLIDRPAADSSTTAAAG